MSRLNFYEFLEFFCRAANMHFLNSEMEGLPLSEKIGHLMDEVFAKCLECERVKNDEVEMQSESDDEY